MSSKSFLAIGCVLVSIVPALSAQANRYRSEAEIAAELRFEVEDPNLALDRANHWLKDVGHLPTPYGVQYVRHQHNDPTVKRGVVKSSCELSGDLDEQDTFEAAGFDSNSGEPLSGGLDPTFYAPNPTSSAEISDAAPSTLREFRWEFKVKVLTEGNSISVVPTQDSNLEMAWLLAQYMQTGAPECARAPDWFIDPPRSHPVGFDPSVHRIRSPTISIEACSAAVARRGG